MNQNIFNMNVIIYIVTSDKMLFLDGAQNLSSYNIVSQHISYFNQLHGSQNPSITPYLIFLLMILLPITIVVIGASIKLVYEWRSKKWGKIMKWEENVLYDSSISFSEETSDFCSGDEDWMLPTWLQNKKEIIFAHSSVIKDDLLGRGQFGEVFKGKLIQGKAV